MNGDRLVGKVDATRDGDVLRVHALHDVSREEVQAELEALAAWLGLELA